MKKGKEFINYNVEYLLFIRFPPSNLSLLTGRSVYTVMFVRLFLSENRQKKK